MKSVFFQHFNVTMCQKLFVVQLDCSRVIFHYKSSKFEEMFALYIKHTTLDKNHTEPEVQCSGCVPTYHLKRLILSSDVFIFIYCVILVRRSYRKS